MHTRLGLTSLHQFSVFSDIVRSDRLQETYVLVAMVTRHLLLRGWVWSLIKETQIKWRNECTRAYVYLHFPIEPVIKQQIVRHPNPVWLHGVTLTVIIITNITFRGRSQ